MFAIALLMVLGVLALGAIVLIAFRSWDIDLERTETRLHAADSEVLAYDVPPGQDPAVLTVALARAGFVAVPDTVGAVERVLVECPRGRDLDRQTIREVLQRVHRSGLTGVELPVGRVAFEDES